MIETCEKWALDFVGPISPMSHRKNLLAGLAVCTGQFAHDLVFSLMSNFKMPKGEFVGQFSQASWINFHRHSGS
jgi:hypothetical protein